jgi:hypothetical protein
MWYIVSLVIKKGYKMARSNKDLQMFKKLSEKTQFEFSVALVKKFPKDQQDAIAEDVFGMSLKEAIRIMNEL